MTRWRLPVLVPLGVGLVIVALLGPTDRNKLVLSAIGVLISLIGLWRSWESPQAERGLDELADLLAVAMRNQWTKAANDRRILQPAPLPIRWCRATEPVAGPTAAATLSRADHAGIEPLPGLVRVTGSRLRRGTRRDLHRIYGGLASGRMLIIGGSGTGKSATAILLLLDALNYRDQATLVDRPRIPVPVLFTLQNWDPTTTTVEDWLSTKLAEIPLFRGRRGKRYAITLLRAGHIAIFLDGLDEIPAQTQHLALRALSEQVTYRLVLLTRTAELATATQYHTLAGAVALELQSLTPTDVANYILRPLADPAPPAWQTLAISLNTNRDSAITQALATPLAVGLLRDTYQSTDPVDELCDTSRFPTSVDITNHLLDHAITTAYAPRLGQQPSRYTPQSARRTLSLIAHNLGVRNTRDLRWWTISEWIPFTSRALTNVALGAITFGLAFGLNSRFLGAFLIGSVLGYVSESMRSERPKLVRRIRLQPRLSIAHFKIGFSNDIASRFKIKLILAVTFGGLAGVGFGLTSGLEIGLAAVLIFGPIFLYAQAIMAGLGRGLAAGLVEAGTPDSSTPEQLWRGDRNLGFTIWLVSGSTIGLVAGYSQWAGVGLVLGLGSGLWIGLIYSEGLRALLSQTYLWARYRTPANLIHFLEDARERHLLRTVGPVYQFRHATLQDRLASLQDTGRTIDHP